MAYSSPPTKLTSDSIAASDWNTYVKGNLDEVESRKDTSYVQYTSSVLITATVEASSTTIVTAGAVNANGVDLYEIEFFCSAVNVVGNAGGNDCTITLFDGGTKVGRLADCLSVGTTTINFPCLAAYRLVPTNGSHTYSARAFRSNANCNMTAGLGGVGTFLPGYIRVRKVQ